MADGRFVYRFARDLRLDDHAGIARAASFGEVVPLLVLDAPLSASLRRSPRRAAFYNAAVQSLDAELRAHGSGLIVRTGDAGAVSVAVAKETGAAGVAWSASYDAAGMERDAQVQSKVEEAGLRAAIVHDAPAIPPEEVAEQSSSGDGYRAFAPFFDAWLQLSPASHEQPLLVRFAACRDEPSESAFAVPSAAEEAPTASPRALLDAFLAGPSLRYANALTVPSDDGTSHLSAHLSFGTLSARAAVRAVRARLDDPLIVSEERFSLRRFLRSLALRDFFLQLSWFHPETSQHALQEKMRDFRFARSHPALDAWREGRTGFPLIDAGMRQLLETGWMHPHVRAVSASFLCFDLGVDWRVGLAHWERLLIEDDAALATGNWQWIAGVGADMAAYPRIYNPLRQRRRCDPDGVYVTRWIPELRSVPVERWPQPHADRLQLAFDLSSPDGYPQPVLDHEAAALAFLARYRELLSR